MNLLCGDWHVTCKISGPTTNACCFKCLEVVGLNPFTKENRNSDYQIVTMGTEISDLRSD